MDKDKNKELLEEQENPVVMGEDTYDDGEEMNLVIKLKKPYLFEGKEYTEIDLTALEDLTAADMIALENQYDKRHPGINMMAARALKQPVEFFNGLTQRDAVKVKTRVVNFLFGSD